MVSPIQAMDADGFNGDTMGFVPKEFYDVSVKLGHSVAIEPEGRGNVVNDGAANWDTMGWGCQIRGDAAENKGLAIACSTGVLEVFTREACPEDWAMTQGNLGTAYRHRIGNDRASNLLLAVDCFTASLDHHDSARAQLRRSGDAVQDKAAMPHIDPHPRHSCYASCNSSVGRASD